MYKNVLKHVYSSQIGRLLTLLCIQLNFLTKVDYISVKGFRYSQ